MDYFEQMLNSQKKLIVFALDKDYKYLAFNKNHSLTMKKIWGVEIEKGKSMLDFILLEVDRIKAKANFDRALKREEFQLIEAYGDTYLNRLYFENSYSPIYDDTNDNIIGVSVFVRDVSEQKNTEELLRRNQNLLASINQNIRIGIYRSSIKEGLVYVNRAMLEMFGYASVSEMLSVKGSQLYDESFDRLQISEQLLEKGEVSGFEVLYKRKDGSTFWGATNAIATTSDDGEVIFDGAIRDISESKQSEQKLQEFSKLFKVSNDLLAVSNFDGYFEVLNPKWPELLGFTIDELKSKPLLEFVHPEDLKKSQEKADEMYAEKKDELLKFENRYIAKNGKIIWLEWNSVMDYVDKKSYSVARDITAFKKKENLQNTLTHSLLKLSRESSLQYNSFTNFIDLLLKEASKTLEVSRFSFWRFNFNKAAIECISLYNLEDNTYKSGQLLLLKDFPIYINALKTERTLAVIDGKKDPRTAEFADGYFKEYDIHSLLDAQVIVDKKQLGIVCAEQQNSAKAWSYEERNYVASLSELVATAYSLYERDLASTALLESERKFKSLFEYLPIGVQLINNSGQILECNEVAFELLDLSKSQLIGRTVHSKEWDIIKENNTPFPSEELPVAKAITTKKVVSNIPMGVYRPNLKTYIWLEVDAVPILNKNNEVSQVISTFVDITKRRNTLKSLKESEERFRNLFKKGQLVQLLINPENGEIVDANEAAENYYGYSLNTLTSMAIQEINQLSEDTVFKKMDKVVAKQQEAFSFKHKLSNGEIRDVDVYSTKLEYQETNLLLSVILDVTERVNAIIALKDSQEMLSNIANNIPGVVVRYITHNKANSKIEFVSKGIENLLGFTQEEVFKNPTKIWSSIHKDDLELFTTSLSNATKKLESWQLDYRVVLKNGTVKWISGRGTPKVLEHGEILWNILALDITQQRIAETEMEKLASVAEKTSDMLLICDEKGIVSWANSAHQKVLGIETHELIGKSLIKNLVGEDTSLDEVEKLKMALALPRPYQGILKVYKKDGEPCWLQYDSTPIFNKDTFLYSIVVKRDVTDLLERQKDLEKLLNTTLDQNNRLKEFSYITSHNIRSSVANLLGLTDIILSEPNNLTYIEMLKNTTEKLDKTIRNLSNLLYFENQFNPTNTSKCSVKASFTRVLELIDDNIKENNVTIYQYIAEDLYVTAIPAYLDSIFHNLITNAIKYGLTRHSKKIDVSASEEDDQILIEIKDYGMGLDLEKYGDKLFKLGSRLHSNADGQGLGLFMTKNQIEALGGKITVASKLNMGTKFSIRLPKK